MYSIKNIDHTSVEHAVIAGTIQFVITGLCYLMGSLTPLVVVLAALPGIFGFYFREQAQFEQWLKRKEKANEITYSMSIRALAFWYYDEDSFWDFILPLAGAVMQVAAWLYMH